jgi:hypothetical protein
MLFEDRKGLRGRNTKSAMPAPFHEGLRSEDNGEDRWDATSIAVSSTISMNGIEYGLLKFRQPVNEWYYMVW